MFLLNFSSFLENYKKHFPTRILSYTFLSFPFDQLQNTGSIQISPLNGYPSKSIGLKGIESNYLQTVYSEYYIPTEFEPNLEYPILPTGQKDGCFGLYQPDKWNRKIFDDRGVVSNHNPRYRHVQNNTNKSDIHVNPLIRVMLQEGARYILNLDPTIPSIVRTRGGSILSSVSTMTAKLPGFGVRFSSYRTVGAFLQMVCSMPHFKYLMEHAWGLEANNVFQMYSAEFMEYRESLKNFTYGIPKEKVFIKLEESMGREERRNLANGLRNLNDQNAILFDIKLLEEESDSAFFYIDVFFSIVSGIALILSFFLIVVSFKSNIQESAQEIGVLRAIGVNKQQIDKVFVYEAITLTFVAGSIGTCVGLSIAFVLTAQFLAFVELPLHMEFPFNQFSIIFLLGIMAAGIGSWLEINNLKKLSISRILKGNFL